jgi:hypothetical protein
MNRDMLAAKIVEARTEITAAEAKLELVLGDLRSQPRAEKTSIQPPLEEAFARLRNARERLVELEATVAT